MNEIFLSYKIINNTLLVACQHNQGGIANAMVMVTMGVSDATMVNARIPQNEEVQLQSWLKEQFAIIKNLPEYSNVKKIIYVGDVNLNFPAKAKFPDCIVGNFIHENFMSPAVGTIFKILYSGDAKTVSEASLLNIRDAEIYLNAASACAILKEVFERFEQDPFNESIVNYNPSFFQAPINCNLNHNNITTASASRFLNETDVEIDNSDDESPQFHGKLDRNS